MNKQNLFTVAIFSLIVVVSVLAARQFNWSDIISAPATDEPSPPTTQQENVVNLLAPDIADSPFARMTIPFLRKQEYQSQLSTLEKVAENANYQSFITSYTSEGLTINGLLTQPTGQTPDEGWPAIVFVHGYIPPQSYQTLEKYEAYVDYLARNGYVVFKIDLRGHGDSEGDASGAYYSGDYVIDTLHAYSALQNADFVNPDKIGLWGHSMAGNVVLRTMAAKPTIPVGVIWAGAVYTYTDLQEYRIQDSSYQPGPNDSQRQTRRRELFERHGTFDPNNEFWKQVIPTNYLAEIQGAIQLNHAVDDSVVDVRYSRNLTELLNNTAIPHELHEYSSGGHNISGSAFSQAMQETVSFFDAYLKE